MTAKFISNAYNQEMEYGKKIYWNKCLLNSNENRFHSSNYLFDLHKQLSEKNPPD